MEPDSRFPQIFLFDHFGHALGKALFPTRFAFSYLFECVSGEQFHVLPVAIPDGFKKPIFPDVSYKFLRFSQPASFRS